MRKHTCWDIWRESSCHFRCGIYPLNEIACKPQEYHIRSLNKELVTIVKREVYGGAAVSPRAWIWEKHDCSGKDSKTTYNGLTRRDHSRWERFLSGYGNMKQRKIKSPRLQF